MCGYEGSPVVAVAWSLLDSEVLNRHMFKEIYRSRKQSPWSFVVHIFDTEISSWMCGCEGSPVVAVASSLLDSEVLN